MLLAIVSPESIPQGGIAAFDLSGTVGVAYGPDSLALPLVAVEWTLPLTGGRGAKGTAFEAKLVPFLQRYQPSAAILERALPLPAMTDWSTTYQQFGLAWSLHVECYRERIAVTEIDAISVRNAVLGQARFGKNKAKAEVLRYCRRRGIRVPGHHAGDAALLWLWRRMQTRGEAPCPGPLWREART